MAKRRRAKIRSKVKARPVDDAIALYRSRFSKFAHLTAHAAGSPLTFLMALSSIMIWATLGPVFGYSDTWQLVINTGTTIVTFLMVFLIQNTQNRDTMAVQLKLSELIIAMRGAKNSIAMVEELSEADLERLHKQYCLHAESMERALTRKRGSRAR